jgi:hypothetical protein
MIFDLLRNLSREVSQKPKQHLEKKCTFSLIVRSCSALYLATTDFSVSCTMDGRMLCSKRVPEKESNASSLEMNGR